MNGFFRMAQVLIAEHGYAVFKQGELFLVLMDGNTAVSGLAMENHLAFGGRQRNVFKPDTATQNHGSKNNST